MKQITRETFRSLLPKRPRQAHKGSFGRVLVVAGSRTMCGAGLLCAKSALRAGAGMVFWALPESMQPSFAAALPEAITLPMPQNRRGEIEADAFYVLQEFIRQRQPSVTNFSSSTPETPLRWTLSLVHPVMEKFSHSTSNSANAGVFSEELNCQT